jgi:hypothetical protein
MVVRVLVLVLCLDSKIFTRFQVDGNKFVPGEMLGVIHQILLVHSANVRTLFIDHAASVALVIVSADSIAAIEKASFLARIDMLTAQAALSARKGFHVR